MFQTKFNATLQMFFIKLNMIFFQKPPKTLNTCIFQGRHHWGGWGAPAPPNNFVVTMSPVFSGKMYIINSAFSLSTIVI